MATPSFTALAALGSARGNYRAYPHEDGTRAIVTQEVYKSCYRRKYCLPPIWLCQDVCFKFNNEPVYSKFYKCGWCLFGIPGTDIGLGWFD
jgi:hypothetical protein